MCPACIANIALIAAGATSSGGFTAFVANKLYRWKQTNEIRGDQNENQNREEPNEPPESGIAC